MRARGFLPVLRSLAFRAIESTIIRFSLLTHGKVSVARCVVEEAKRRDRLPSSLLGQRPEAPAPPRCITLERGGDTSNSGFRPGRRNFVDARSGECRSRGIQGRRQGVHDRTTIRAIAVRGAKGACLGDAGAQTLSLVPRTGTARLTMHVHIMCDTKRVTPPILSLRLCLRR